MSRLVTSDRDGLLYCIVNESMPGICKIGVTHSSIEDRMKSLHTTGLPTEYTCFAAKIMSNPYFAERNILEAFAPYRITMKREFLRLDPSIVQCAIDMFHGTWLFKNSVLQTTETVERFLTTEESSESQAVSTSMQPQTVSKEQVLQFVQTRYQVWDPLRTDLVRVKVPASQLKQEFVGFVGHEVSYKKFGDLMTQLGINRYGSKPLCYVLAQKQ